MRMAIVASQSHPKASSGSVSGSPSSTHQATKPTAQIDSAMTRLRVVWALDVPVGSVSLAVIDTKVNDR